MQLQLLLVLQPQIHGQMSDGKSIFKEEAKSINEYFAELNYEEDPQGSPAIVGELVLRNEGGTTIDKYSIKIVFGQGYPYQFPLVYEIGGRLPVNIDWHVFPDGHCCIKAGPEEKLLCRRGITLSRFIKEQLIPYFFNQKYRELNGFFLNERPHGRLADLEFFLDHFKTQDVNLVLKLLMESQSVKEHKSNSKCLCGSNRKFKKCHRRAIRETRIFSANEMIMYITLARAFLLKQVK